MWYPGRPEERDGARAAPRRAGCARPRAGGKDRDLWLRPAQRGSGRVLMDPSRACSADRPTRPAILVRGGLGEHGAAARTEPPPAPDEIDAAEQCRLMRERVEPPHAPARVDGAGERARIGRP